jgi:hypothetical protein
MPGLTFTRKDIRDYGSRHAYAQLMFCGAGNDYAAARCLSLNNLMVSGFPLFSQSIEKLLKAIIFLETDRRSLLKGPDRHRPFVLKQELQQVANYDLDRYDAVLQTLYGHFQQRYYDNDYKSKRMSSEELDGFDELWMHLFERIPFPVEVKYRLKFLAMLFEQEAMRGVPTYRHWVIYQNKAIASKLKQMEATYFAVKEHYINSKD